MDSAEHYYTSGQYWKGRESEESRFKVRLLFATAKQIGVDFKQGFTGVEIGCGNGAFLFPLEEELLKVGTHCDLLGLDISPQAISLATKRSSNGGHAHLNFSVGSVHDIRKKVDYIFVMDVIEHVENPYEFLRALNGKAEYIFIHLPLENSLSHVALGKLRQSYHRFRHLHFFSWDSATIMIEECKFKVIGYVFTGGTREIFFLHGSVITKVLRTLRFLAYGLAQNTAVSLMGGSVMIAIKALDD
jgi:hypothetical protein